MSICRRAVLARLGLGELHRPARVAVLLPQLGRLLRPALRDAAGLDRRLLGLGVALLRRRHDRGVDDLPAHGEIAGLPQRGVEAREQRLHRAGPLQRLAEGPDGVGVRHRVGQAEPEEAHEGQPVLDQVLGPLVRQRVHRLQQQHLEHQHVVEGRTAALRAVRPRHRPLQIRAEPLEVHQRRDALQVVALGRQLPQPLLDIEEARLPSLHPASRCPAE